VPDPGLVRAGLKSLSWIASWNFKPDCDDVIITSVGRTLVGVHHDDPKRSPSIATDSPTRRRHRPA
jgi:hypothetical protein